MTPVVTCASDGKTRSIDVGVRMHDLIRDLYPICRSITGDGTRETLRKVGSHIPLEINEVATGTQVFDWTVPREWNIRDAYVKNSAGVKVIDFSDSNLHVLNYSIPIHAEVTLAELRQHLFTLPEHPEWIPYRTSYYKENWGFCLSHNRLAGLAEDRYEVLIDASLENGHLSYGECYLAGESSDEILFSCHVCHPSLCNDNLSGIALSTYLAAHLKEVRLRCSYRFLFVPGTIGAITWLALNEGAVKRVKGGLVVAGVGDRGKLTYKRSRQGASEIDRAVECVLKHSGDPYDIVAFTPYGYDERQYCSPASIWLSARSRGRPTVAIPNIYTSADNLDLVQPCYLADSFDKYLSVVMALENNRRYVNQNPKCEPQLGKRGLYRQVGGVVESKDIELAMLWVLNLSDGANSLLDVAEQANMRFDLIHAAAAALEKVGLLKEIR